MMEYWKAKVRLFFHCLRRFHRSYHAWDIKGTGAIGCADCERSFWKRKDWVDLWDLM